MARLSRRLAQQIAALYMMLSALRGPGTHTRDPIHPDVSDIAGRRAVHRRKADIGTKVGARESLEKVGPVSN